MEAKIRVLTNAIEMEEADRLGIKIPQPKYVDSTLTFALASVYHFYIVPEIDDEQAEIVIALAPNYSYRLYYDKGIHQALIDKFTNL